MSDTKFEVDKDNMEVRLSHTFNASPERLWKAHTDPNEIVKWWEGTTVDQLDFRVGGKWRFVSGSKGEHAFRGEFKEIDEPRKIVRTFEYEPQAGHIMVETLTLEALTDGRTKQTTVSKYASIDDLNGMVEMGMERGATAGMERLAKIVENS